MSAEAFDRALSLGKNHELLFDKPKPVSEAFVATCEDVIGYSFPASYRRFLLQFGFGGVESEEFCGLLEDRLQDKYFLNGYWVTEDARNKFQLPSDLFVIQAMGDSAVCLLLSQRQQDECPVILWDFSEDATRQQNKPFILAQSFGEYYLEKITEMIANEM